MLDKEGVEIINLTPLNFSEIIQKTADCDEPMTEPILRKQYEQSVKDNREGFVWIVRVVGKD